MFLRNFNRNNESTNPKVGLGVTLVLGVLIYGYFYFYNQFNKNIYPYFQARNNQVITIERFNGLEKDTVSLLYRLVNPWRYFGTNLGLYCEASDSLIAEFTITHHRLQAIYSKIPFYDYFDKSRQQYGVTIMPPAIKENSRWIDNNLGLRHKVIKMDTLSFAGKRVACLLIETRLNYQSSRMILKKMNEQDDSLAYCKLDAIKFKGWLNWYSEDFGWLKTIYPDGRQMTVLKIDNIYWFERIPRFFNYGVQKSKIAF